MKTANDILNDHKITGQFRFVNEDGCEMKRFDIEYAMESYAAECVLKAMDEKAKESYLNDSTGIQTRIIAITNKFKLGQERFKVQANFNVVVNSLARGYDTYKVIDSLLEIVEKQTEQILDSKYGK